MSDNIYDENFFAVMRALKCDNYMDAIEVVKERITDGTPFTPKTQRSVDMQLAFIAEAWNSRDDEVEYPVLRSVWIDDETCLLVEISDLLELV